MILTFRFFGSSFALPMLEFLQGLGCSRRQKARSSTSRTSTREIQREIQKERQPREASKLRELRASAQPRAAWLPDLAAAKVAAMRQGGAIKGAAAELLRRVSQMISDAIVPGSALAVNLNDLHRDLHGDGRIVRPQSIEEAGFYLFSKLAKTKHLELYTLCVGSPEALNMAENARLQAIMDTIKEGRHGAGSTYFKTDVWQGVDCIARCDAVPLRARFAQITEVIVDAIDASQLDEGCSRAYGAKLASDQLNPAVLDDGYFGSGSKATIRGVLQSRGMPADSSDILEVYECLEEAFLAVAADSLKEAQRRSHTKQWRDRVPLQRGHLRHYLCQLRPKSSTAGKGRAPCPDPAARR